MNQGPLFSIVVPTHNRPAYLEESLRSVLNQDESDWECIVVDDASQPPAKVPNDSRVRLLRNDVALGPAEARSIGIRASVGEFICFLDDDDLFPVDRLTVDRSLLDRTGVAFHWASTLGGTVVEAHREEWLQYDYFLNRTTPSLGTVTVRRDLAVEFDASFPAAEDLDWLLRVLRTAEVIVIPRVGWLWRQHDGPRGSVGVAARLRGSEMLLAKHALYFGTHRHARAFRLYRMGLLAIKLGDLRRAQVLFWRSLSCVPHPRLIVRNVYWIARSLLQLR